MDGQSHVPDLGLDPPVFDVFYRAMRVPSPGSWRASGSYACLGDISLAPAGAYQVFEPEFAQE